MNELKNKLEKLNLNKNEAAVYLALLKFGQTSAGKIITETRLHRSVVYETLTKLIDRKLAFKLEKNKISYFQATNPDRLLEDIKRQETIAKEIMGDLKGLIDAKLPEITIYEGLESYRRFWLETYQTLPVGSIDYVAGSIGKKWIEYLGLDEKKINKIRIKRKIKWKMIVFANDDYEKEFIKKYPQINEYRLIARNVSRLGNFNVFNEDSVILHSVNEPMIIEIKNKNLAKVFLDIFDILWDLGKPL